MVEQIFVEHQTQFLLETNRLLNWFLDVRSACLDGEGSHRQHDLAEHIAACYRIIQDGLLFDAESRSGCPISIHLGSYEESYWTDDSEYRLLLRKFIEAAGAHIGPFIQLAIIHGSQADETYVRGWSDIDTLVVLRDDAATDHRALVSVREGVFSLWQTVTTVCPFQHHGLTFVTEGDLSRYLTPFMPLEAFRGARRFLGKEDTLTIRIIPRPSGALRSLEGRLEYMRLAMLDGIYRHHPYQGKYLLIDLSERTDNMYQLFAYLNYEMLVPSLYFDACGTPVYKGESFAKAKGIFSRESLAYLDFLSSIRKEWEQHEYGRYTGNSVPEWVVDRLGKDYFKRGYEFVAEAIRLAREGSSSGV